MRPSLTPSRMSGALSNGPSLPIRAHTLHGCCTDSWRQEELRYNAAYRAVRGRATKGGLDWISCTAQYVSQAGYQVMQTATLDRLNERSCSEIRDILRLPSEPPRGYPCVAQEPQVSGLGIPPGGIAVRTKARCSAAAIKHKVDASLGR